MIVSDEVSTYFGVKIAMYFAWLGHYTTALIVPAIVGFTFWVTHENVFFYFVCRILTQSQPFQKWQPSEIDKLLSLISDQCG
jgi:hypothetical protein